MMKKNIVFSLICVLLFNETQAQNTGAIAGAAVAVAAITFVAIKDNKKEMAKEIASQYQVDILVNNTGGPAGGPITEATGDAFLAAFNQHLINNQHCLFQR